MDKKQPLSFWIFLGLAGVLLIGILIGIVIENIEFKAKDKVQEELKTISAKKEWKCELKDSGNLSSQNKAIQGRILGWNDFIGKEKIAVFSDYKIQNFEIKTEKDKLLLDLISEKKLQCDGQEFNCIKKPPKWISSGRDSVFSLYDESLILGRIEDINKHRLLGRLGICQQPFSSKAKVHYLKKNTDRYIFIEDPKFYNRFAVYDLSKMTYFRNRKLYYQPHFILDLSGSYLITGSCNQNFSDNTEVLSIQSYEDKIYFEIKESGTRKLYEATWSGQSFGSLANILPISNQFQKIDSFYYLTREQNAFSLHSTANSQPQLLYTLKDFAKPKVLISKWQTSLKRERKKLFVYNQDRSVFAKWNARFIFKNEEFWQEIPTQDLGGGFFNKSIQNVYWKELELGQHLIFWDLKDQSEVQFRLYQCTLNLI